MYHDEFAKRPARIRRDADALVDMPSLPIEVGGGLSLGLAASLNPSISNLLLGLGGLLPLVLASFAIALHRASEFLGGLAPLAKVIGKSNPPVPHFATINPSSKVDMQRYQAANRSIRGRSEDSRKSRSE